MSLIYHHITITDLQLLHNYCLDGRVCLVEERDSISHETCINAEPVVNDFSKHDLLFEAHTPLDFSVGVTRFYWKLIVTVKHPVMAGKESEVQEALENPEEI